MHTLTFYPQHPPTLEEVQSFVQSFPEGDWVTATGVSRGVIEADDARIYLDYDDHYRDYYDQYLDERQRAELTARLGFSPTLALHVQASHHYRHSRELAQEVCERLVKQWGGGWDG